jgi:hypothetical protein
VALGAQDRDRTKGDQLLALAVERYHSGRSAIPRGCRLVATGIPGPGSRDRPPTEVLFPSPPGGLHADKRGISSLAVGELGG